MVCGSFFKKMVYCNSLKNHTTFLTGARKSHFNHKAQKEKSKPRETDCEAGLHIWRMMSDNGFDPPSSLWLQGSFQTDACTYWVMFSDIKPYSLYRGWMEHLLGKMGKKWKLYAIPLLDSVKQSIFCHWIQKADLEWVLGGTCFNIVTLPYIDQTIKFR